MRVTFGVLAMGSSFFQDIVPFVDRIGTLQKSNRLLQGLRQPYSQRGAPAALPSFEPPHHSIQASQGCMDMPPAASQRLLYLPDDDIVDSDDGNQ